MEQITKSYLTKLNYEIVSAAIEVHSILGPGLLESIYEECLYEELKIRSIRAYRQVPVKVNYKGKRVKDDLRIDLLVEDIIIVELKAVKDIHPVFKAQLMSYMKLSEKPKGLLINFNVLKLVDGVTSLVNDIYGKLPE